MKPIAIPSWKWERSWLHYSELWILQSYTVKDKYQAYTLFFNPPFLFF